MSFSIDGNQLAESIREMTELPEELRTKLRGENWNWQLEGIVRKVREATKNESATDYEIIKALAGKLFDTDFCKHPDERNYLVTAFNEWSNLSDASHATRVAVKIASKELSIGKPTKLQGFAIWVKEFFFTTIWRGPRGKEEDVNSFVMFERACVSDRTEQFLTDKYRKIDQWYPQDYDKFSSEIEKVKGLTKGAFLTNFKACIDLQILFRNLLKEIDVYKTGEKREGAVEALSRTYDLLIQEMHTLLQNEESPFELMHVKEVVGPLERELLRATDVLELGEFRRKVLEKIGPIHEELEGAIAFTNEFLKLKEYVEAQMLNVEVMSIRKLSKKQIQDIRHQAKENIFKAIDAAIGKSKEGSWQRARLGKFRQETERKVAE